MLARDDRALWRRYAIYADVGAQIIRKRNIRLIASYNLLGYAPVGAWLAHENRLPHVISIFGEIYKYSAMARSKEFFSNVCERAFRLLSCSEHCGSSLRLLGVHKHVHAVTYGVNVEHFSPGLGATKLRDDLGIDDAPVVLFVGRLGTEMGLDSFLAAAELSSLRCPEARFVIVGQDGDLAAEAEKQCEASSGRFLLKRNVPYADLPNYYRLADILVVPTRGTRTCSSLAAMEAMATRKPVIGFSVGGIPEIVENERTGLLVAPEDCKALAEAISRLLTDGALRNRLAESGYRQAQARFDERQVNVTMERHFLDALGAHES
jgi:glycosyltransferase involved in cell wall biosynthesis